MNEKIFFSFIAKKYLSHNNIVQQHFLHKYSLQRVPNPVEMLEIDGFHCDIIRLQSQKSEVLRIRIYTRLKINRK